MDDRPAIEYHPFGTITINFDDGPIKLRRCRLGDLAYAKDLLEEVRGANREQRDQWIEEINPAREALDVIRIEPGVVLTEDQRAELRRKAEAVNTLASNLEQSRIDLVYGWLSQVIERMGDNNPPPKDDWPLELVDAMIPSEVIGHWQTRPLASGRPTMNGARDAAVLPSEPSPHAASSPLAPPSP